MDTKSQTPSDWLLEEFNQRKAQNHAFSLRAFAKYLGIPASRLSEILSQKRQLSLATAAKISDRLMWQPEIKMQFIQCVEKQKSKPSRTPESLQEKIDSDPYHQISADAFNAICEWHHYAILALVETKDFKLNVPWIARRLGIEAVNVRAAINRLERLGLLRVQNGKVKKTHLHVTTSTDISSAALRKGNQLLLHKATEAINQIANDQRDITSIIMAIDPAKLTKAKELIKNFRRELAAYLETDNQTQVYSLCIQLFPLSKIGVD